MSSLCRGLPVRVVTLAAVTALANAGLVGAPMVHATAQSTAPLLAAPTAMSPSAAIRGAGVSRRGVPVRDVRLSDDARTVSATVVWNQALIARKGNRDRFNIRLVAFGSAGAASPIVLTSRSKTKRPPAVEHVRIKLGKAKAKTLRASGDAVLAVSQQHGRAGTRGGNKYTAQQPDRTRKRSSNKYTRNYVTVTRFRAGQLQGKARGCRSREIRPGADLSGCDLSRANLLGCDLSNANLTNAILTGAILRRCGINGTRLAGADLTGVVSGGITGVPASLPQGWQLINGFLTLAPLCTVGDTGPGGGKIFYVDMTRPAGSQCFEAAPTDVSSPSTTFAWAPNGGTCYDYNVVAAQPTGIGAGKSNTAAIVADPNCNSATKAPAAWAAHEYVNDGLDDWFLPSGDELNQLITLPPPPVGEPPVLVPADYWASSQAEYFAPCAMLQNDPGAVQNPVADKNSSARVRPVRSY